MLKMTSNINGIDWNKAQKKINSLPLVNFTLKMLNKRFNQSFKDIKQIQDSKGNLISAIGSIKAQRS